MDRDLKRSIILDNYQNPNMKHTSNEDYVKINTALDIISKTIPNLQLIISPMMNGGVYNGWLKTTFWDEINEISK